jgi:hypothetical protein
VWDGAEFKPTHLHIDGAQDLEAKEDAVIEDLTAIHTVNVSNPTLREICFTPPHIDRSVVFWKTVLHPIIFLASPTVLWAVFYYGIHLACQIIMM